VISAEVNLRFLSELSRGSKSHIGLGPIGGVDLTEIGLPFDRVSEFICVALIGKFRSRVHFSSGYFDHLHSVGVQNGNFSQRTVALEQQSSQELLRFTADRVKADRPPGIAEPFFLAIGESINLIRRHGCNLRLKLGVVAIYLPDILNIAGENNRAEDQPEQGYVPQQETATDSSFQKRNHNCSPSKHESSAYLNTSSA
jgi:hypothetical protein